MQVLLNVARCGPADGDDAILRALAVDARYALVEVDVVDGEREERERVRARMLVREATAMAGSRIYRSLAWANRKLGAGIGKSREFVVGKVAGLWSAMAAGWRERETEAPRWGQGRS